MNGRRRNLFFSFFLIVRLTSIVLLMAAAAGAAPAGPPDGPLALVGGTVYPAPDATPIANGVVLLQGARIAAVGARASIQIPAGATTIDCSGLFLAAGFQNSHVHFTEPRWVDAASQPASKLASQIDEMLTRYGFTTVVDTGSLLSNTAALRRRIASGEVRGPRILTAGSPLYPPAGVPFYLKDGSVPPDLLELLPQPATPTEAVRVVAATADGGADIIKLFTGSWVARGRVLPMPVEIATAAAAEAHRRGKLVFTHASSVALVPTLTLFANDSDAPEIFAEVRDYARLGGRILFGTDVGYHDRYDPSREYELMARAGLSWREILASLTVNPAARFGESSRRGRLAAGMDADVTVLGGDPAADVRAFADVRHVIRRAGDRFRVLH